MNIDLLHRLFIYDHVNGVLYWKDSERRHLAGDDVTKNQSRTKYPMVRVDGVLTYVHIVAWCMYHNTQIPDGFEIDHIDRNTWNFKAENLRAVTHSKNQENRTDSRNKRGEKGISFNKLKKKFEVCIRIDGKSHRKCGISTLSDAIKIRDGFMNGTE